MTEHQLTELISPIPLNGAEAWNMEKTKLN